MYLYDIDVDILVNGKPIKKFSHDGKVFVESKHWTEYSIRVKNSGFSRRLIVVSVDGMNVINGEAAGKSQAGYVINGYSSTEIKGFRTSNDVVHPFKFNRKERSYAAKSDETQGDTTNCGVIGVAVYSEKEKVQPKVTYNYHTHVHTTPRPHWNDGYSPITPTWTTCSSDVGMLNTYSCSSSDIGAKGRSRGVDNALRALNMSESNIVCDMAVTEEPRGFDMGTEFSEREVTDQVVDVDFEIGILLSTISIYYASRAGLISMGVPIQKQMAIATPNPFPKKFCALPNR